MSKHQQTEKLFSLKDLLFNEVKVKHLASEISSVYPSFDTTSFTKKIVSAFPKQELMERIVGIREALREFLPTDYKEAVKIILAALPPPLDPEKTDNDFGDFIYAPYSYYVAEYGCSKKYLSVSLKALAEITKRFSAEAALRNFLNQFPKETLATALTWSKDKNYHVRRLASEGTRPNLPWAKKITYESKSMLPLLDILYADTTRYVTRSVANHLNDISKFDPGLVIRKLKRWQKEKKQTETELAFITKHALRTLVKQGDQNALQLLGFSTVKIKLEKFELETVEVNIGTKLKFYFNLNSLGNKKQKLKLSYLIYFKKANGKLAAKVFDLGQREVMPNEEILVTKEHPLRLMTTRTLYTGEHRIVLQVNGQILGMKTFWLLK